jgi:hypothetical protein
MDGSPNQNRSSASPADRLPADVIVHLTPKSIAMPHAPRRAIWDIIRRESFALTAVGQPPHRWHLLDRIPVRFLYAGQPMAGLGAE